MAVDVLALQTAYQELAEAVANIQRAIDQTQQQHALLPKRCSMPCAGIGTRRSTAPNLSKPSWWHSIRRCRARSTPSLSSAGAEAAMFAYPRVALAGTRPKPR